MAHWPCHGWIDWWADELNPNSQSPVRYSFENVPASRRKKLGRRISGQKVVFWLQCIRSLGGRVERPDRWRHFLPAAGGPVRRTGCLDYC